MEYSFCSVTEILNSYDASKDRLYYSAPTKQGRATLLSLIKEARSKYPCDLFILGLHLNEPEYVRTVSESKKHGLNSSAKRELTLYGPIIPM